MLGRGGESWEFGRGAGSSNGVFSLSSPSSSNFASNWKDFSFFLDCEEIAARGTGGIAIEAGEYEPALPKIAKMSQCTQKAQSDI